MREQKFGGAADGVFLRLSVSGQELAAVFLRLEQAQRRGEWVLLQAVQTFDATSGFPDALLHFDWPAGGGVVLASGGSEGERSFCLQPWFNLDRSAAACGQWLKAVGLDPRNLLFLSPLPFHHVSGLMPWWRSRFFGGDYQVLEPALMKQPEALMAACIAMPGWGQKPMVVSLVPTQLKRLIDHAQGVIWLQQMALVWVGGASLPASLAQQARRLNLRLAPCYGATETAAMVAAQTPQEFLAGKPGCGAPLADVQLQLDSDGALMVRTERLALARWRDGAWKPLADADGWWRSGDAASISTGSDACQWLEIRGRIDGAIHSGGETVFPEQLGQRLLDEAKEQLLPLEAVLLLPEESDVWGQRLVGLVRFSEDSYTQRDWLALVQRLSSITAEWFPAERPMAWHHCPELEASAEGKWQRERWQAWLKSQAKD